jgi:integrase
MNWEREDRIFEFAWQPGDWQTLAHRYAQACGRVPPLARQAAELAAEVKDQHGLDHLRETCYLRSRSLGLALESARTMDFVAPRAAIEDLTSGFPDRYPVTNLPQFAILQQAVEMALKDHQPERLESWLALEDAVARFETFRRSALLANPLLDFESLLVIKRVPLGGARRTSWEGFGYGEYLGVPRQSSWNYGTMPNVDQWTNEIAVLTMNCFDISAADIKRALGEVTKGATRWRNGLRYVSAILGDQVKAGLLTKNPAAAVAIARKVEHEDDDVTIYTTDELKSLFAACIDYPVGEKDKRCAGCAIPFAVMAFSGIRPDEVTKLKWEHISLELGNIRVGEGVAKKASRRNVRIQPALAAWLNTVPEDKRKGRIIPPRWRYKAAKVRTKAGICGREKQDALRHSFGTYLLAVEGDLDALKADMGHAHMAVFFNHYHKAVTKADALPYWQILPPGAIQIPTMAAV